MSQSTQLNQKQKRRFLLFTALVAIPIVAVFTFPLIFQWRTHVLGFEDADSINHAWASWWYAKALFTLNQSPSLVNYIYYPTVVNHPIVIATSWPKLVALPFILSIGAIPVHNLHLFFAYVFTWVLMTWLCLELTGSQAGAFIGGMIFTLSTGHTLHSLTGHFAQALFYIYPMLVLAVVLSLRRPGIDKTLGLAVTFFMAMTTDLTVLAYFVGPILFAILIYFWLAHRKQLVSLPVIRTYILGFGIGGVASLPFVAPLIIENFRGNLDWFEAAGSGDFSADVLAIFVPPPDHLLAQLWPTLSDFSTIIYSFGQSSTEAIIYAGWATLFLAVVGVVKLWETNTDVKFWFTSVVVFSILALGPLLRFAGRLININETPIILPYVLFMQVPFLSWGRTPARFHLTAMFALSILAAYGFRWLVHRYTRRKIILVTAVAATIIFVDSLSFFPWPMRAINNSSIYETIAADSRAVAVLEIPATDYVAAKTAMLYQMQHGHALAGGFRVRQPVETRKKIEALQALALPGGNPRELAEEGIAYVILQKKFIDPDLLEEIDEFLFSTLPEFRFEDDEVIGYEIPNPREIAPQPLNYAWP